MLNLELGVCRFIVRGHVLYKFNLPSWRFVPEERVCYYSVKCLVSFIDFLFGLYNLCKFEW